MLYAQTDPDPGQSNYKYPFLPPSGQDQLSSVFFGMARHIPDCDATCLHFQDHARHFCCRICQRQDASPAQPPSPTPTADHCPTCRSPAGLTEEVAKLAALVAELTDFVVEIHDVVVGGEPVVEEL